MCGLSFIISLDTHLDFTPSSGGHAKWLDTGLIGQIRHWPRNQ